MEPEDRQYLGALYYAVQTSDLNLAKQLLEMDIDVTTSLSSDSDSLSFFAVQRNDPDILSLLLKKAGLNNGTEHDELVRWALENKSHNVLSTIFKLRPNDPTKETNNFVYTNLSVMNSLTVLDMMAMYNETPDFMHCLKNYELYGLDQRETVLRLLNWSGKPCFNLPDNQKMAIFNTVSGIACQNNWPELFDPLIENEELCPPNLFLFAMQKAVDYGSKECISKLLPVAAPTHTDYYVELLSVYDNIPRIDDFPEYFAEDIDICHQLIISSRFGSVGMVKYLFQNDIPIDQFFIDRALLNALSAEEPNLEIVKILIQKGAYIQKPMECQKKICKNYHAPKFHSPLDIATLSGNFDLVKLLLDNKADISIQALQTAIDTENTEILHFLLTRKAKEFNKEEGIQQITQDLMHHACSVSKPESVKVLLQFLDVITFDDAGNHPMHLACSSESRNEEDVLAVIQILLEAGSSLSVKTWNGSSPMNLAIANYYPKVFEYLIEKEIQAYETPSNLIASNLFTFDERAEKSFPALSDDEVQSKTVYFIKRLTKLYSEFDELLFESLKLLFGRIFDDMIQLPKYLGTVMMLLNMCKDTLLLDNLLSKEFGSKGIWKLGNSVELDCRDNLTSASLCEILSILLDKCSYSVKSSFIHSFERHLFKWSSHNPYILSFVVRKLCGVPSQIPANTLGFQLVLHDSKFVSLLLECGFQASDIKGVLRYWFGSKVFSDRWINEQEPSDRIEHIKLVKHLVSSPVSLQIASRKAVRQILHKSEGSCSQKINDLPVPSHLKSYISMS